MSRYHIMLQENRENGVKGLFQPSGRIITKDISEDEFDFIWNYLKQEGVL